MKRHKLTKKQMRQGIEIESIRTCIQVEYAQFVATGEQEYAWDDFRYVRDTLNALPIMKTPLAYRIKKWGLERVAQGWD